MNKHDFIRKVAAESGETIKLTEKMVASIFEVIGDALVAGDSISVINFGTFSTKPTAARICTNLKTGEKIDVPASKKVSFKISDTLRNAVRGE